MHGYTGGGSSAALVGKEHAEVSAKRRQMERRRKNLIGLPVKVARVDAEVSPWANGTIIARKQPALQQDAAAAAGEREPDLFLVEWDEVDEQQQLRVRGHIIGHARNNM